MSSKLTILAICLSLCLECLGQEKKPIEVFYKHIQSCHHVGTTEEALVLELFSDSTVKFSKYSTNYMDGYTSVLRFTYTGTYLQINDSLKIEYSTHNSQLKCRDKFVSPRLYEKHTDTLKSYPSKVWIKIKKDLVPVDKSSITLTRSNFTKAVALEKKFAIWETIDPTKPEPFDVIRK